MIKIIFTRPNFKARSGGVTIYVRQLIQNLNKSDFCIVGRTAYFKKNHGGKPEIDSATSLDNFTIKIAVVFYLILFPYLLKKFKVDIVHANPSFSYIPIIRDAIFTIISSFVGVKSVMFIHGWKDEFETAISRSRVFRLLLSWCLNKSIVLVLAQDFKKKLREYGVTSDIIVETTMVDDELTIDFDIKTKLGSLDREPQLNVLFLSRIQRSKGIFEAVDAIQLLSKNYPNLRLIVAGSGDDLPQIKHYVSSNRYKNVQFVGYVTGKKKKAIYASSEIFLFPTYSEGMPISVLEAMAFGLPVVTTAVGGLKDFFQNGRHGFLVDSISQESLASALEKLITDKSLRQEIALFNHNYARENFMASKVVKRIEDVYLNLINS